jgi:4'-phosphopantetheinyl transferase
MPTGPDSAAILDGPVLRIGSAFATVVACPTSGAEAHAACATSTIRRETGDPTLSVGRRPSGRPRLLPPHRELGISLAARSGLLGIGLCLDADVGIDLEVDDAGLDAVRLARDHFAPAEAALVAAVADARIARRLFLRLWCAKEAVLKASGRGIFDGLAEPNLAAAASELQADAVAIAFAGAGRIPPAAIAIRNLAYAQTGLTIALARL